MQINLSPKFNGKRDGIAAQAFLRNCGKCGFCIATCPACQLLGDELAHSESQLCCSSAASYWVRQPELATQLHDREQLEPLHAQQLQTGITMPVKHRVEVIDEALS